MITLDTADRLAIHERLAACAWALDTGTVEDFVACFCTEGTLEWDAFEEPQSWQGHAALRHFASFLRDLPTSAGRQHHISNTVITPGEDCALAKSYVTVALRQGDGPHQLYVMGWYEDALKHENGDWRLWRRVIRDWSGPVLASFAGQSGERVARPMPAPLLPMRYRPDEG
ncbi:nuclear transport factor 2 family protein [Aurantiacibacter flavus]|uniref:Nuclear transport factor 2 family protein n=1 Tax=Aurantiacibacter flavus TaxID=3145232 RepID=A0ABV0CSC0_9SPHN